MSPSVKAGGYGTAGWAIGGDVIIDMSKLVGVNIEPPQPGGGYTSLRDLAAPGSKGKGKAGSSTTNAATSGKRRRDEDSELRSYDSASVVVASFLRAPGIPSEAAEMPSPSNRRRLDPGSSAVDAIRPELVVSGNAAGTEPPTLEDKQIAATSSIAKSPQKTTTTSTSSSSKGDPFGYMQFGSPTIYQSSPSSHSLYRSFGTGTGRSADPGAGNSFIWSRPIHQHAYVTFGAGVRQKEIDRYTAEHPLEAASLSGMDSRVPYHVPLSVYRT